MRRALGIALLLGTLALPACANAPAIDGARALARVERQLAFGPRISGTEGNARMREWMVGEFTRLGATVEQQAFTDSSLGRPLPLVNVIARYGPAGARRIVICAHYDSRPWCDQDPDTSYHRQPMPGANDGGSGVAVLLELAELLHKRSPRIGIDLVAFDGEDFGTNDRPQDFCLGSKGYAKRLPPAGDPARPVAAFLLDMIGDRDLQIWTERNSAERATNLTALVTEAATATGAAHFHPEIRYDIIDDHVPLLDAGLPAVDLIDFDYPAWHTHRDLADQVSAASLAEVSRVMAWICFESALAKP